MPVEFDKEKHTWVFVEHQCCACNKKEKCKNKGSILPCEKRSTTFDLMKKNEEKLEKRFKEILEPRGYKKNEPKHLLQKRLLKLLREIQSDKKRFEKDFYNATEQTDKQFACLTMKEDYAYFERKLKEMI